MKKLVVKAEVRPLSPSTVNQFAQSWLISTEFAEELLFDLLSFNLWLRVRAALRSKQQ